MYRINDKNIAIKCRYTYVYIFFVTTLLFYIECLCMCTGREPFKTTKYKHNICGCNNKGIDFIDFTMHGLLDCYIVT